MLYDVPVVASVEHSTGHTVNVLSQAGQRHQFFCQLRQPAPLMLCWECARQAAVSAQHNRHIGTAECLICRLRTHASGRPSCMHWLTAAAAWLLWDGATPTMLSATTLHPSWGAHTLPHLHLCSCQHQCSIHSATPGHADSRARRHGRLRGRGQHLPGWRAKGRLQSRLPLREKVIGVRAVKLLHPAVVHLQLLQQPPQLLQLPTCHNPCPPGSLPTGPQLPWRLSRAASWLGCSQICCAQMCLRCCHQMQHDQ